MGDRQFFGLLADDDKAMFLNIDQVRIVDEIRPGHCRLYFDPTHIFEVNGPGADAIVARLSERAIALNGEEISPSVRSV
jgi:hypothetical protein